MTVRLKRKLAAATFAAAFAGVVATPVLASPNTTQYGNPSTKTPTKVTGSVSGKTVAAKKKATPKPSPTIVRHASPGSLPFTGMDLAVVAALGAGLAGAGIGIRALSRTSSDN